MLIDEECIGGGLGFNILAWRKVEGSLFVSSF
jgi:hypothetical protein